MSRSYTVSELADKVRNRGEYKEGGYITDAMLIDFIDSAHTEVYDLLVGKWEDYYVTVATFSTTADVATYTLPTDFYKLLGLDVKVGDRWRLVRRYNLTQRNDNQNGLADVLRYRLEGNNIHLIPTSSTVQDLRITYIPRAPILSALDDSVDGVNGWEELVVLLALRRCKVREEASVTAIDTEIARQMQRLESAADARDAGESESLQDLTNADSDYWFWP